MSIHTAVILRRERMLTPADWVSAIQAAGFPADLDVNFDPLSHSGFLPCSYRDEDAGFEYFFSSLSESGLKLDAAQLGTRDFVASFVTHSRHGDLCAATAAASALASATDGVLYDAEGGELVHSERSLEWARQQLDESDPAAQRPVPKLGKPFPTFEVIVVGLVLWGICVFTYTRCAG